MTKPIIMSTWFSTKPIYTYCPECGDKAWRGGSHEDHNITSGIDHVEIQGVLVVENFVSEHEEIELIKLIDSDNPWVESQEGRAKQDFGPRVNFMRKKAAIGNFCGFPKFATNLLARMQSNYARVMNNFIPVEFCLLEYKPERGSYIRPHYDDTWVWGDRLITVNLLSDTCLRLTKEFNIPPIEIVIKMPARSLLVIQGEARYDWHHSISRYDIKSRRVAMTWREFSDEIMKDEGYKDFVAEVLAVASQSVVK